MSFQLFKRSTMIACLVLLAAGCGGGTGSTVPATSLNAEQAASDGRSIQTIASVTTSTIPKTVSGLSLWLDGADSSTITQASGRVSQWRDKSGNGNNVGQTTQGNQPAISGDTLTFGTTSTLIDTTPVKLPIGTSAVTVFFVGSQTASGNYVGPIAWGGSTSYVVEETPSAHYVFGAGSTAYSGMNGVVNTSPHVVSIPFAGGAMTAANPVLYFDGAAQSMWTSNTSASVSAGPLRIGTGAANTVSELLVYTGALSTANRQTIEGYLAWKWGLQANLPASHPYKAQAPSGMTIATPAPSSAPVASYTSSSYNQITNPAPWPANFRPFAANSPWNMGTAGHTQNSTLTAILRDPTKPYTLKPLTWDWSGTGINGFGTGGEPAFLASSTDPLITISCTAGCFVNPTDWSNNSEVSSIQIRIPAKARPATDYDEHLTVIQQNGEEVDCYHVPLPNGDYVNGGTYSSQDCVETPITTSSGIIPHSSNAAGRVNTGGMIRFDEYQRGVIPHALYFFSGCSHGSIPPAQGSDDPGGVCGTSLPEGAWIHLALSDAQIAALPASSGNKAVLTALAHYGGWLLDSAGSSTQSLMGSITPCNQYAAYGQACPWPTSGTVVDWPSLRNNLEILNYP